MTAPRIDRPRAVPSALRSFLSANPNVIMKLARQGKFEMELVIPRPFTKLIIWYVF